MGRASLLLGNCELCPLAWRGRVLELTVRVGGAFRARAGSSSHALEDCLLPSAPQLCGPSPSSRQWSECPLLGLHTSEDCYPSGSDGHCLVCGFDLSVSVLLDRRVTNSWTPFLPEDLSWAGCVSAFTNLLSLPLQGRRLSGDKAFAAVVAVCTAALPNNPWQCCTQFINVWVWSAVLNFLLSF